MNVRDTSHEAFEELAVGHALHALEPEDEGLFLAHLPGCARCERAVAEHRATLGHLAYVAADEEPPPALLAGILAGVEASGRAGDFPAPISLEAHRQRRTVTLRTALVGVAASFVLLAALVVSNVGLQSRNSDLQTQATAFQRTVTGLITPGARRVQLTGKGDVVAVLHGNQVSLVLSGVAANDRAHSVYVLWQRNAGDGVTAAGTFDVSSTGLQVVNTGLSLSRPAALTTLMVTLEAGRVAPPSAQGPLLFAGSA